MTAPATTHQMSPAKAARMPSALHCGPCPESTGTSTIESATQSPIPSVAPVAAASSSERRSGSGTYDVIRCSAGRVSRPSAGRSGIVPEERQVPRSAR